VDGNSSWSLRNRVQDDNRSRMYVTQMVVDALFNCGILKSPVHGIGTFLIRNGSDEFKITSADYDRFRSTLLATPNGDKAWNKTFVSNKVTFTHFLQNVDSKQIAAKMKSIFDILGIPVTARSSVEKRSRDNQAISYTATFTIQREILQNRLCCIYGVFPHFIMQLNCTLHTYLEEYFKVQIRESDLQDHMITVIKKNFGLTEEEEFNLREPFSRGENSRHHQGENYMDEQE